MNNSSPGVKSDQTLFQILSCISEEDGVNLTGIADTVGKSKSTVHDHLSALREEEFVLRRGNEYHLGPTLLEYGIKAQRRWDIYDAAKPKLGELVELIDERTWCFVDHNYMAVYLCGEAPKDPFKTPHHVGDRAFMHHLAGGKAILAHRPESYLEELIEKKGLPQVTENTITDESTLRDDLERIREQGLAYNNQEAMESLRAIAAPVRSIDSEQKDVIGAVTISGPANRLSDERIDDELRAALLGTVNEIELNMREF